MIYLAESGSTKTDAAILDDSGNEVTRVQHMGFNPYFHSSEFISRELSKIPEVKQYADQISQVYFYGAGCSSPSLNQIVIDGLQPVFPDAEVHVDHDLKAAAYATYSGEPAVTCILGTGSNSVYFDGTDVQPSNSGLGFILGDEGSASDIGKKLITAYYYKTMPAEFRKEFEQAYNVAKDHVVRKVYQEDHANIYLAGFAPFASKHREHPFFYEMIFNVFKTFLQYHVLCFENARQVPVNFVGSVAFHLSDLLKDVLHLLDLKMGHVVQKPLEGLINYHRNYVLSSTSQTS